MAGATTVGASHEELDLKYPSLYLGQHDSSRDEPLNDLQYGHMLNLGVSVPSSVGILIEY